MTTECPKYKETTGKEIITDWRLSDVSDRASHIFKQKASAKSKVTIVYCKNTENCDAYKKDFCINFCPYSKTIKEAGFTAKSLSNRKWISKYKEMFKDVKQKSEPKKMIRIGDYIYFDYSFWNFNVDKDSVLYKYSKGIFNDSKVFIEKEDFTVDFIKEILESYPKSLMGGNITEYNKKVAPMILLHLKEEFNDLYCELLDKYPIFTKFVTTNIGRVALIKTIKKDVVFNYQNFDAVYKGDNILRILNYPSNLIFLNDVKVSNQKIEYDLIVGDNDTIVIKSENQCDENTIFLN